MGILESLFNSIKSKKEQIDEKKVSNEESKFNLLSLEEQNMFLNKILELDNQKLKKYVEKKPYILPHIMDKVDDREYLNLVDIATKNGVSFLDLVGKNPNISDKLILALQINQT